MAQPQTLAERQAEYLRSIGATGGPMPFVPQGMGAPQAAPQPSINAYAPGLRGGAPAQEPQAISRPQMTPDYLAASDASIDAASAQMAKQQHGRKYNSGRGILGLVNSIRGGINKDEKLAGFQDTAKQGLTAARDLAELEGNREWDAEQAALVQQQKWDSDAANKLERGRNTRSQAELSGQNMRSHLDRDARMDVAEFNQGAQNTRQSEQIEATALGKTGIQYYDPSGAGYITTRADQDGREFTRDADGKRTYVDTTNWQKSETGTQGSTREARVAADTDLELQLQDIRDITTSSTLANILTSPQFAQSVGPLELRRPFAEIFPSGVQGRERQSVLLNINNAKAELFGPVLSQLGVNPTDKDAEIAFETVPSVNDDPQVWTNYIRDIFAPRTQRLMLARMGRATEDGRSFTRDQIDEVYSSLMDLADDTDIRMGYMEPNGQVPVNRMSSEDIDAEIAERLKNER